MENILNKMFEDGIFSNIFFVDENPALINFKKNIKENGEIKTIDNTKCYKLTSLVTKNSDEDIICSLLHNFFVNLNFKSERVDFKYFDRGLIKNLFTKRNPEYLLNEIINYNWIIASENIISELSRIDGFEWCEGKNTLIKLRGRFDFQYNTTIIFQIPKNTSDFKHGDNNIIYCGNYNSITPVINKNIKVDKDNNATIEYLFYTEKNLKRFIIT
jgi:hypothetical protein